MVEDLRAAVSDPTPSEPPRRRVFGAFSLPALDPAMLRPGEQWPPPDEGDDADELEGDP